MSEKKINKVTQQLDKIKNMSKEELKDFIVKQTGRNANLDFSSKASIFSAVLFLILGVSLTILSGPIGWWFIGFTALTTVFSVVFNKMKKYGKKTVDDCTAELSLRIKQETEEEFKMVKNFTKTRTVSRVRTKTQSRNMSNTTNKGKNRKPKTANTAENINTTDI